MKRIQLMLLVVSALEAHDVYLAPRAPSFSIIKPPIDFTVKRCIGCGITNAELLRTRSQLLIRQCCQQLICPCCFRKILRAPACRHPLALGDPCYMYRAPSCSTEYFYDHATNTLCSKHLKPHRFVDDYRIITLKTLHLEPTPLRRPEEHPNFSHAGRFRFDHFIDQTNVIFGTLVRSCIIRRALQAFQELHAHYPKIIIALDPVVFDWSGAYFYEKNIIILSNPRLLAATPERILFVLLHELAHALQHRNIHLPDDFSCYKENYADRIAALRMGCSICLQRGKIIVKEKEAEGYFNDNEYDSIIAYLQEQNQYCPDHRVDRRIV